MDTKIEEEKSILDGRLQNILNSLSKCKIDLNKENEECKKLREVNSKLEIELKEMRELEKSHRFHLMTSREMIGNLQETVSQLVYLKRDIKKLKDQLALKDANIVDIQKDNENASNKLNENIIKLRNAYEQQIEDLKADNKREIQQIQHECDAQVAQFSCVIEELRSKMKEMEAEHRDKINVIVLEYEEKVQREAARAAQLQEELARETARTDLNIDAYRRRLEELEEKLKQSQFKQYLQSSYPSQYESQVERPYSVNRDPYSTHSVELDPVHDARKFALDHTQDTRKFALDHAQDTRKFTLDIAQDTRKYGLMPSQNKTPKCTNSLQVIYYDKNDKTPKPKTTEKKGLFHITKKRKLYNEKEFQDF